MPKSAFAFGLMVSMVGCMSNNAALPVHPTARTLPAQPAAPAVTLAEEGAAPKARGNAADSEAANSGEAEKGADLRALSAAMPTRCAQEHDCVPPKEFSAAACHGRFPSMAIAMFEKHTPWQRLYLRAETLEAVNAYGNRSVAAPLVYGEEVIVLRGVSQPKAGKLQISSSDIDVLRWDGTCATVAREYFSTTRMPEIAQAAIPWRYLEDTFQEALLTSKSVAFAQAKQRSACKGSRANALDAECQRANERLSDAIGMAVRGGLALPIPVHLPTWATREQLQQPGTVAMNATAP